MLAGSSGTAVSHYSDWSTINWIVGYSWLLTAVAVAAFAVTMWLAADDESSIGIRVGSVALGAAAGLIQLLALRAVVRHIEQLRLAVGLALLVIVAVAGLTYLAARAHMKGRHNYYTPAVPLRAWVVPASASTTLAIVVLVIESIRRVSDQLSMGGGSFALVTVAAVVWLVLHLCTPETR